MYAKLENPQQILNTNRNKSDYVQQNEINQLL